MTGAAIVRSFFTEVVFTPLFGEHVELGGHWFAVLARRDYIALPVNISNLPPVTTDDIGDIIPSISFGKGNGCFLGDRR
jgi:hypothetical protein